MSSGLTGCTPTTTTTTTTTTTASPAVTLQPSSLTFPSESTGTTSPPQTVTVQDTGTASLFVNGISHGGTAAQDFTVTQDMCSGMTVAAGASCTLTITFTPTADGARTAALGVLDNAPASPQTISLTGCDVAGSPRIVNNFFAIAMSAQGGTAPYTWSAVNALPPGLAFKATRLLWGSPTSIGTSSFTLAVTDSAGATTSGLFTITVGGLPPASPSGCQKAPDVKEVLSGQAIGGKTPNGQAQANDSQLTSCGGYAILTVNVSNVNLANATVLWVSLDGMPVGTITLSGGSGSMKSYNLGDRGLSFDQVTVVNGPPPAVLGQPTVVSGGSFS